MPLKIRNLRNDLIDIRALIFFTGAINNRSHSAAIIFKWIYNKRV